MKDDFFAHKDCFDQGFNLVAEVNRLGARLLSGPPRAAFDEDEEERYEAELERAEERYEDSVMELISTESRG